MIAKWQTIDNAPEGVEIETVIADDGLASMRNQQLLIRQGKLWFFPDRSMYVYYEPTHWRWIQKQERAGK